MNDEKFSSLSELYQRLTPALKCKCNEMGRAHMIISEAELWKYLCTNVWKDKNGLTIDEMVDNILNSDSFTIFSEVKNNGTH